jgi:hypothetical protein
VSAPKPKTAPTAELLLATLPTTKAALDAAIEQQGAAEAVLATAIDARKHRIAPWRVSKGISFCHFSSGPRSASRFMMAPLTVMGDQIE